MKRSTAELLRLLKNQEEYTRFHSENKDDMIREYLSAAEAVNKLIDERGLKKAQVIADSEIEIHYGYQILAGTKTPSRDKMLMLCFGIGLNIDEAQRLLTSTGYMQLYSRYERDNVIMFGLNKQLSVLDVNNLLYDLNLDLLL